VAAVLDGLGCAASIKPVLRCWSAYFRDGESERRLNAVDGYAHERLALIPGRKRALAGRNWTNDVGRPMVRPASVKGGELGRRRQGAGRPPPAVALDRPE
jgi:hypothetical protein